MDMRVFPFSFPPIPGGAQGGVSPTPTPEEPGDSIYDADSLAITLATSATWASINVGDGVMKATANGTISIAGITALDVSQVASISIDASDITWKANGVDVAIVYETNPKSTATAGNIADPTIWTFKFKPRCDDTSIVGKTVSASGNLVFAAYDSDGNVLQSETVAIA